MSTVLTDASALGIAAHAVLAAAVHSLSIASQLDYDLARLWDWAVSEQSAHTSGGRPPETWWRYNIVRRGTLALAKRLVVEIYERAATTSIEQEVRSPDRALWGRPDLVLRLPDATVEVVDFKTGAHEFGPPDDAERQQLMLYGFLVESATGAEVRRLRLERIDGDSWSTAVCSADLLSAAAEAFRVVAEFNLAIPDSSLLARPGAACSRCSQVLRCDIGWTDGAPDSGIEGKVEMSFSERGLSVITLTPTGTSTVSRLVGVPAEVLPAEGAQIRAVRLHLQNPQQMQWQSGRSAMRVL